MSSFTIVGDDHWRMTPPATATARRAIARKARQHGHFDTGRTLWVTCPVCRDRVETDKPYGYGHNGVTSTRVLDRMMVDHLTDYCQQ
jgi:hypothetical protein